MPLPVPAGVGAGAESGGSRKVRSGEAGATRRVTGSCGAQAVRRTHRSVSPGGGWGAGRSKESPPPLRRIPCGRACARVSGVDGREGRHHDEAAGATLRAGVPGRGLVGARGLLGRGGGGRRADEFADAGEGTGASAVAEEPVVADVLEAPGEAVQEEAPQELDGVEGHRARAKIRKTHLSTP